MERKTILHPMRLVSLLIALGLFLAISMQHQELLQLNRHTESHLLQEISQLFISTTALSQSGLVASQDRPQLQLLAEQLATHPVILDVKFYDAEANLLAANSQTNQLKQQLLTQQQQAGLVIKSVAVEYADEVQGYLSLLMDYEKLLGSQTARELLFAQRTTYLLLGSAFMGFCFAFAVPFRKLGHLLRQKRRG